MKLEIALGLSLLTSAFSVNALDIRQCNSCSNSSYYTMALGASNWYPNGGHVYISDIDRGIIKKYYVISIEGDPGPIGGIAFGPATQAAVEQNAYARTVEPDIVAAFNEAFHFSNAVKSALTQGKLHLDNSSPVSSSYHLIGNPQAQSRLSTHMINNHFFQSLGYATHSAVKSAVLSQAVKSIVVKFPDGTTATLTLEVLLDSDVKYHYQAGSAKTPEGAGIPDPNVVGVAYLRGYLNTENSVAQFMNEVQRLGIPVVDLRGPNPPNGGSMECYKDGSGLWTCTITRDAR